MKRFRGIFPALQAPFLADGAIDLASMKRQVEHCIAGGAHGLAFPVMAGELFFLADEELTALLDAVVTTAAGRVPVVAGASATCREHAVWKAAAARTMGADAVIALPPFFDRASEAGKRRYYQAVAEAAGLPVFIQHSWPGMSPEFIAGLMRDVENISYLKEETPPSGQSISGAIAATGDECLGVFGGAHGYWMISEMRRGAAGFIPGAQAVEIYVAMWDRFQSGDEAGARAIYEEARPLFDLLSYGGISLCKEVLKRRGVFRCTRLRKPQVPDLDAVDHHELDLALARVEPYFVA